MDNTNSIGNLGGGQNIPRRPLPSTPLLAHVEQFARNNSGTIGIVAGGTATGGAFGFKCLEMKKEAKTVEREALNSSQLHLANYDYSAEEVIRTCKTANCSDQVILQVFRASGQYPEIHKCVIRNGELVLANNYLAKPRRLPRNQVLDAQFFSSTSNFGTTSSVDESNNQFIGVEQPAGHYVEANPFNNRSSRSGGSGSSSFASITAGLPQQHFSESVPLPASQDNSKAFGISTSSLYLFFVGLFWVSISILAGTVIVLLKQIVINTTNRELSEKNLTYLENQISKNEQERFYVKPKKEVENFNYLSSLSNLLKNYQTKKMDKLEALRILKDKFNLTETQGQQLLSEFFNQ